MSPFASFPPSASINSISLRFLWSLSPGGIPQCLSTSAPASPLPAFTASPLWSSASIPPFPPLNPSLHHHLWPGRSHRHRDTTHIRTQPTGAIHSYRTWAQPTTTTTTTIDSNRNPLNQNKPNQNTQITLFLFFLQTIQIQIQIQKVSTSLSL